ncbi:uncharacterized protein BX664DRAFT_327280 [Halteromyces radiatus]|uniref:uncharacterized protein n=1 Tax=Halteromyces radiatus TaxID=101107 RepID=UPI00221E6EB3|nr:uncharacterized protein BX664DRAFT_327280 [Halteromyces radiatus]KAI8097786.1 hypothetical protein BX664DRAFT_327280 [Halteromyces radiatus]
MIDFLVVVVHAFVPFAPIKLFAVVSSWWVIVHSSYSDLPIELVAVFVVVVLGLFVLVVVVGPEH